MINKIEYKVEKILNQDKQEYYLINQKGYLLEENIWEFIKNLIYYAQKFQEF